MGGAPMKRLQEKFRATEDRAEPGDQYDRTCPACGLKMWSCQDRPTCPGCGVAIVTEEKGKYDPSELAKGIEVEKEHTEDAKVAERIAKDHLDEFPDYYTRLARMEKQAKKDHSKKESFAVKAALALSQFGHKPRGRG